MQRYELNAVKDLHILPGDEQICSIEWGMNVVAFHKCTDKQLRDHPIEAPFGTVIDTKMMNRVVEEYKVTNPKMPEE